MLKFFGWALITLSLASCGATKTAARSEALAPPSSTESAYLIATIGVKTSGENSSVFSVTRLRYRQIGTPAGGTISFANNMWFPSPTAFTTSTSKGGTAILALKPGNYEIFNVEFYYNRGQFETTFRVERDFSLPFTLKAGEALYLGEFIAETMWGRNIFGIPIPAGGYFRRDDKRERDLPLLKSVDAAVSKYQITFDDLRSGAAPFIVGSAQ